MSELHKFLFEGLPVRGMLVRLTDSWQELLARREKANDAFPAPVRTLLGEMAAAGALMQSNIKFNGALVLQVFGDGPVRLAVVEVQPDLAYRATAKVVGAVDASAQLEAMVNLHGKGRCAITLDPRDRLPGQQPYQGIVPLDGADLTDAILTGVDTSAPEFARAKGLSASRIVGVHVLKNIMIPIVTVIGLEFGSVVAFAVVTESVFAWPGMGKLLIDSINVLDRPVIVAYLLIIVSLFVFINLLVDLAYSALDPRVRLGDVGAH